MTVKRASRRFVRALRQRPLVSDWDSTQACPRGSVTLTLDGIRDITRLFYLITPESANEPATARRCALMVLLILAPDDGAGKRDDRAHGAPLSANRHHPR